LAQDPYQELGVARQASADEIRRAFRKLAKQLHPDKNPGDKASEERFKRISAAFDLLGDEDKRKKFDRGEIDADGEQIGDPGEIAWFPDRTYAGRTYVPAVARTTEGFELFGFVSFSEGGGGPSEFEARADYTAEIAESNPDWKLDLNDEVIGAWRGDQGNTAEMTLVWGVPQIPGGAIVTAELANLAVDQCELVDERFTLVAPDNYRADYLEVKLWDKRGEELAGERVEACGFERL